MSDQDKTNSGLNPPSLPRLLRLFCQKDKEGGLYRVYLAGNWMPPRLSPFFDEHLELGPLLLDLEYLDQVLQRRDEACEVLESGRGDVEIIAKGEAATAVATWLAHSLASVVLPKRH